MTVYRVSNGTDFQNKDNTDIEMFKQMVEIAMSVDWAICEWLMCVLHYPKIDCKKYENCVESENQTR